MELTLHYAYKLFTIKHSEVRVSRWCFERKRPKNICLKKDARCLLCCCSYHVNTDYIRKCLKHPGAQTEFSRAGEVLRNLGTSINLSSKTQEKKATQGKNLDIFLLDTLKTKFWLEDLTQGWTELGHFFPKSGHFFWFSKKIMEGFPSLPPPLVARLKPYSCKQCWKSGRIKQRVSWNDYL